jgi:N-methylhydantoinase A/oxoprolinase/acetone carboxylase beta subunit
MGFIIGLDMGGTHIDTVIIEKNKIVKIVKKPIDPKNPFSSISLALEELLLGIDKARIKRVNLSTTICTNAIVENKTSPVGMIIQGGPGLPYDFLAKASKDIFISGYTDHRGVIIRNFDPKEIEEASLIFKNKNIKSLGIVTKFSVRNPNTELSIRDILLKKGFYPITTGHSISGKLNFPRRVFTSYLNSAVHRVFNEFSTYIENFFEKENIKAPLFILKADGGTINLKTAKERPVETILSGPAASVMGLNVLSRTTEDAIFLDIGGTTTDIFFQANGEFLFEPLGIKIGDFKTLVRAIFSVSIGLGGDSEINVINRTIKIGPLRSGKPYAFGGLKPTPTDAMIVLGLIETNNKDKAFFAIDRIGRKLNMSAEDAAKKILDIMGEIIYEKTLELLNEINGKPVYTIKELLQDKKIKPTLINIIGGPAKILKPVLEKKFNLPCYYPKNYHVANAIGAAFAKPTTEITLLANTKEGILTIPELGIYKNISKNFTLDLAKKEALEALLKKALDLGAKKEDIELKITEESIFNMVQGFYTKGKNIRIKAQIVPGLIEKELIRRD